MQLVVKKIKKENDRVLTIYFSRPKNFFYYPGQYIDITLPNHQSRSFTLSSSPKERLLSVTVKKGISEFKRLLESLKIGALLQATHPAGTFILDEKNPAIFIAGGIGITPFRSMIKYALDQKLSTPILLIYSNSDNNFVFKKELVYWAKIYKKLTVKFINTKLDGKLTQQSLQSLLYPIPYTLYPIYYLAGPPAMVESFKKILLSIKVDRANIRTDIFEGY